MPNEKLKSAEDIAASYFEAHDVSGFGTTRDRALVNMIRAAQREAIAACAKVAEGFTLSDELCNRDGGCEHGECVTARLVAAAIRELMPAGEGK